MIRPRPSGQGILSSAKRRFKITRETLLARLALRIELVCRNLLVMPSLSWKKMTAWMDKDIAKIRQSRRRSC